MQTQHGGATVLAPDSLTQIRGFQRLRNPHLGLSASETLCWSWGLLYLEASWAPLMQSKSKSHPHLRSDWGQYITSYSVGCCGSVPHDADFDGHKGAFERIFGVPSFLHTATRLMMRWSSTYTVLNIHPLLSSITPFPSVKATEPIAATVSVLNIDNGSCIETKHQTVACIALFTFTMVGVVR